MGIGVSIFLIALGAILTFATDVSVSGLDLDVVGIVLMLVGALGLVMTMLVWGPRRRRAAPAGRRGAPRIRRPAVVTRLGYVPRPRRRGRGTRRSPSWSAPW